MKITFTVDTNEPDDIVEAMGTLAAFHAISNGDEAPAETEPLTEPTTIDPDADKKAAVAAKRKAKAAEKKAAEDAASTDEAGPDRDAVRAALKNYAALEGKDAAIAILKDHGSPSIGELDETEFASVVEACDC